MFWRKATTSGLLASMLTGTVATLVLIWLSPTIQIDVLHRESALFPLKNPALVTIPLSFLAGVLGSLSSQRLGAEEVARFDERQRQMLGA
jgi:cation/acetate symporter